MHSFCITLSTPPKHCYVHQWNEIVPTKSASNIMGTLVLLYSKNFDMSNCHSLWPSVSFDLLFFHWPTHCSVAYCLILCFSLSVCSWFPILKHCGLKCAWYDFSLLIFLVSRHMVCPWECSMWTREEWLIWCSGMKSSLNISYAYLV